MAQSCGHSGFLSTCLAVLLLFHHNCACAELCQVASSKTPPTNFPLHHGETPLLDHSQCSRFCFLPLTEEMQCVSMVALSCCLQSFNFIFILRCVDSGLKTFFVSFLRVYWSFLGFCCTSVATSSSFCVFGFFSGLFLSSFFSFGYQSSFDTLTTQLVTFPGKSNNFKIKLAAL